MAYVLDVKIVFLSPLGSKPLSLFPFTNRAISLLSIGFVEWMPVFAMSFLRVQVGNTSAVSHRVLAGGENVQMLRINTRGVTANMVNDHTFRYLSMDHVPSNAVRSPPASPQVECSVPVLIKGAVPIPTPFWAIRKLGSKANKFFCGKVHDFLLMVQKGKRYARECQYALV